MENTEFSLRDYSDIFKRRIWHFTLPAIFVFLCAVVVALVLPPVYKSSSTIIIEEQEIPADYVKTTVTSYAEQRLQVINQRIMSSSKLLEIINNFNLYKDLKDKWTTEEIIEKMRGDISLDFINADVVDRRTGKATSATIAFTLSYEGQESPSKVQTVANTLASLFLEENLKVREKQVSETSRFFENEMAKVGKDLKSLNAEVAKYKSKNVNSLPELLQVNLQSLNNLENNLERLSEQLRNMKEKEVYLRTQLANMSPYLEEEDDKLADEKRLENLKLELVHLQTNYSDIHPDIIKVKEEIAKIERKMGDDKTTKSSNAVVADSNLPNNHAYINIASQLASAETEVKSLAGQISELNNKADVYRKRIAQTPEVERQYKFLLSERENTQAKYDDLSRKLMEAKVAQGLETEQKGERFTLIDPAKLPEKPYKPNRLAILLIGLVLSVGGGVGFAAFAEFNDRTIHKPGDLTRAASLPVLAVIPEILNNEDLTARRMKRSGIVIGVVVLIILMLVGIHLFVMDFSLLLAKISKKMIL